MAVGAGVAGEGWGMERKSVAGVAGKGQVQVQTGRWPRLCARFFAKSRKPWNARKVHQRLSQRHVRH